MRILWRYIASEYFKAFVAALFGVTAIYLVVDFVDRAKSYTGEGWQRAALELYAHKAVMIGHQLAPAALLMAAGITIAGFRRRGEYTAMRALAISPLGVLMPVAACCLMLSGGLMAADEYAVGKSSRRVDEITTGRFKTWGDWRMFFSPTRWFRGKEFIYHLREGDAESGFRDVTLYTTTEDFRLAVRIDAKEMRPLFEKGENGWLLVDGVRRGLAGDGSFSRFDQLEVTLSEPHSAFQIAKGRPEQLRWADLRQQIDRREEVGLPAERYVLALHNKLAYPLVGLPAALLAAVLALRQSRKGYLTEALAEGFVVIIGLWAMMVMFKAAALAGYFSPIAAAWAPVGLLGVLALFSVRRACR